MILNSYLMLQKMWEHIECEKHTITNKRYYFQHTHTHLGVNSTSSASRRSHQHRSFWPRVQCFCEHAFHNFSLHQANVQNREKRLVIYVHMQTIIGIQLCDVDKYIRDAAQTISFPPTAFIPPQKNGTTVISDGIIWRWGAFNRPS